VTSTVETQRKAPAGFTPQEWTEFDREGFIHRPGGIEPEAVARYRAACEEIMAQHADYDPAHAFRVANVLPQHEAFRDLIDADRHVGYAYDLYGDQLQLVQSDMFVRPPGGLVNQWHIDGPRAVPYRVFSPVLPLKLRIGYWLTDVPEEGMGNYVYVPRSHRADYPGEHGGIGDVPGQRTLTGPAGTMTVAHSSLWHRIDANRSDRTRITLFLTYAPSWLAGYYEYPRDWMDGLGREQRIILRAYTDGEEFIRPPREDLPLFAEDVESVGPAETDMHKIRRTTRYERTLRGATG
jgi:hypothetical protein